jgi:hypothetical protein
MLSFLDQWGWLIGILWLIAVVIFYRHPAGKRAVDTYALKEAAIKFAWRYYTALEAYGVTPERTKEQRPATVDFEWALRDFVRAWLRVLPDRASRERCARALLAARVDLVKDHPELRAWAPDELLRAAYQGLDRIDWETMDVEGDR